MSTENQEIPKTPFKFVAFVSRPFKWWLFTAMFFVTIAAIISQSTAYIFKIVVDAVESGDYQTALWAALSYPVIVFFAQTLYRASGHFSRPWVLGMIKYSHDILSEYIIFHSHTYFSNRFVGSLVSKISNVAKATDTLATEFVWTHLNAAVTLLVTLVFLANISIEATIIFICLIVVLILFNRALAPRKAQLSKVAAETGTALRGRIADTITNVEAVRQFVRSEHELLEIERYTSDNREAGYKNWEFNERTLFYNGVILFIFTMGMFWFLMTGWQRGSVSTGELVLVLSLYSQISGMLMFIGRAINTAARVAGELQEGLEDVLLPHEIVDTPVAKKLKKDASGITWNNVDFSFDGVSVFSDFSLAIPSGERVGLVGHSGAGKTTFVSLMLRQHDLSGGEILIGGHNIAKVTQDSLREQVAIVPQEPMLFHRTIKENILYGNPKATNKQVEEVAKKAQAHDFIMNLPEGYDTMVGERGVKLSGGQKQRVAIARAMLKNAPILILDEATSALDSESEVAIQKALEVLMEGKTVIAVAHRLSTLRKMDRILVMEEGEIIEDGNHEELARGKGVYQKLWKHQAGGFLVD